jgi:peptidoglycan hydrolase-like protein with peptidoglycan-binding domain
MISTKHPVGRDRFLSLCRVGTAVAALAAASVAAVALAGTASASTSAPHILYGSRGEGVKCVQAALNDYDHAGLHEDGIDGPATTAAIRHFQREMGLTADGIVGPRTGDFIWTINSGDGAYSCYDYVPTSR